MVHQCQGKSRRLQFNVDQEIFEGICQQLEKLLGDFQKENFQEFTDELTKSGCSKAQISVLRSVSHSGVSAVDFFCGERANDVCVFRNLDLLVKEYTELSH